MRPIVKSAVLVVLALSVLGAPAAAADPVPLKGVNVLSGDASGYVPVRISKPVSVDSAFAPNDSVVTEGAGRVQALVLRKVGAKPAEEPVLAAGRFDPAIFCQMGCASPIEGISVVAFQLALSEQNRWVLPAGDYRLYLVTDGGPAKVTLRLPELEGEQHLSPVVRTSTNTKVLPSRSPGDTRNMRVHGDSGELGSDGLIFETHAIYYGLHAYSDLWTCWYIGPPTHPLSFYPGCPTENEQEGLAVWIQDAIVHPAPGVAVGTGLLRTSGPGTFSAGGSMTSVSTASSSGWAATWIDFESTGGATAPGADPAPTPPPGSGDTGKQPGSAGGNATSRARLIGRRLGVTGRRTTARLRCEGGSACSGEIRVAKTKRRFTIAANRTARVRIPVSAKLAQRARRRSGVTTTMRIVHGGAVQTVRVTLRSARR